MGRRKISKREVQWETLFLFEIGTKQKRSVPNVFRHKHLCEYLESIDLTDFNPKVMPESEYKNEVVEMSEPSEETFIKQWRGENVPMTELYEAYKEWCISNSRPYATSSITLGKNLLAYGRYYIKKRTGKGAVYSRTTVAP